ncbi:MAG: DUF4910 domain-containing protein [Lachnospiraceae bacterium]|nr:DUF4910 domain-containing protein [Lachnospiraceae bacterium]
METYIPLKELASHLRLHKGDRVFVTSDVKQLLYDLITHEDETDLNILIDGIIEQIGPDGTLVFPTFNWAFCKGEAYDHFKTPCKTGSLGKLALARDDFRRTKHPIYSFAVWGKGQEELCAMDNHSSFGIDSPFTYMRQNHFRNLFIDKDLQHSFVFVHYVEETVGPVPYRYLKDFTADYTDEEGHTKRATYSMNVRDLDLDVENVIYAYEPEFEEQEIMQRFFVNGLEYKIIELDRAFPIIAEDILHNRSRKLCTYIGQDDTRFLKEGQEMFSLCRELFPICRSITGNGVRETFSILRKTIPEMELFEVPSGTPVCDWTIPKEWNITEAYLLGPDGNRVVDMADNNLHVLGYSVPVDRELTLSELQEHLYSLPDQPDLIPYVTSYYKERWGFCMTQKMRDSLKDGTYHAVIRSTLTDGSLTYGEWIIPGETEKEIFLSSYVCHPSMANNECSGPALLTYLARYIAAMPHRKYTYRLVLAPETIGALTYLSRNLETLRKNVIAGFNLTCVGDDRTYSLVHSRYGDTIADRVLSAVLKHHAPNYRDYSYLARGSDERQYQAPGVELPMVCFCRSKYHVYPEYHTSADNLDLISPDGLAGSYDVMVQCIEALEHNRTYRIKTIGEPQLGKYGLVPTMSSKETYQETLILKDVCAYADGRNDLLRLSELIDKPVREIIPVLEKLDAAGLLEQINTND